MSNPISKLSTPAEMWHVVTTPPAPMNHVEYLRAGLAEMRFQNLYTANTNHFRLTDFCLAEMNNTTGLSNKHRTA